MNLDTIHFFRYEYPSSFGNSMGHFNLFTCASWRRWRFTSPLQGTGTMADSTSPAFGSMVL